MAQTQLQRFLVCVYTFAGPAGSIPADELVQATECAKRQISRPKVTRVTVWDRNKGPVLPDYPGANGLILELPRDNSRLGFRPYF
jgi:hypothetical protein